MRLHIWGNSNFCSTYNHFKDNGNRNVTGLDLWNGLQSNPNMLIDSSYATSYLMAIVMLTIYFTIFDIYSRNVHDLALTFRISQGQMKICQCNDHMSLLSVLSSVTIFVLSITVSHVFTVKKAICDFLFAGNSDVFPMCHCLLEIRIRKIHDVDIDL